MTNLYHTVTARQVIRIVALALTAVCLTLSSGHFNRSYYFEFFNESNHVQLRGNSSSPTIAATTMTTTTTTTWREMATNSWRDFLRGSSRMMSTSTACHRPPPIQRETLPQQQCLSVLGQNGTWVQDWDFAAAYGQYEKPLVHEMGPVMRGHVNSFQPAPDAPYRWETSWKWQDYNDNNQDNNNQNQNSTSSETSSCQVDYTVNGAKLCDVLLALNISRVLFYGDSLTESQFQGLINKAGRTYAQNFHEEGKLRRRMVDLVCRYNVTNSNNTTNNTVVTTTTTKIIRLMGAKEGGGQEHPKKPRHPLVISNETRAFIRGDNNETGRLLGILNIGAHYHNATHYREDFDELLQYLDNSTHPDDLFYFRTTVPGHEGCEPRNVRAYNWTAGLRVTPLPSLQEVRNTTQFDWHLFENSYNRYSRRVLGRRRQQSNNSTAQADIRLLDVYPMTVLRWDGHTGGGDCLHYLEPGPTDWWNHLLYTHLVKEQEIRQLIQQQQEHQDGCLDNDDGTTAAQ